LILLIRNHFTSFYPDIREKLTIYRPVELFLIFLPQILGFGSLHNFKRRYILNNNQSDNERVSTAVLLAAGTGSRLYPLTKNMPKCLTEVSGIPILERLLTNLTLHGFKRLIVVTGYLQDHIKNFLGNRVGEISIDYVFSPLFRTTNNIYSLWMARKLIKEPFLLIESDLVFDDVLLDAMVYPDRIAVAKIQPWMNGTCVTINKSLQVKAFLPDSVYSFGEQKYKTVNIYCISLDSWHSVEKTLDKHIAAGNVNNYYETVFAEMIADGSLSFETVSFDGNPWYEIDTIEDLITAEELFPVNNYLTTPKVTSHLPDLLNMELINASIASKEIIPG